MEGAVPNDVTDLRAHEPFAISGAVANGSPCVSMKAGADALPELLRKTEATGPRPPPDVCATSCRNPLTFSTRAGVGA